MKKILVLVVFYFVTGFVFAQKTLLIEKIGTSRKYFYHAGDYMKLRVSRQDTLLKGKLWSVHDSVISISELRPFDVRIKDIGSVYKQFSFPKKFGKYMAIGSMVLFTVIAANHLINNEQVFTPDMFILSGSLLGAGIISLSLSEKRCKTSRRWKIKVLNVNVN
ncbi:MAG: hypothetical protein NTW16_17390 [Bacteroidetes bacterium]|nr:hypothetical protein [Bacteroidota bacterium]